MISPTFPRVLHVRMQHLVLLLLPKQATGAVPWYGLTDLDDVMLPRGNPCLTYTVPHLEVAIALQTPILQAQQCTLVVSPTYLQKWKCPLGAPKTPAHIESPSWT